MHHMSDFTLFFRSYIEALRWAEMYEGPIKGDDREALKDFCREFFNAAKPFIDAEPGMGIEEAGHDFYLTHTGHGAGFWDGDWPETGHHLTGLAEDYPNIEAVDDEEGGFLYIPTAA
jgi:hypothetical protein